jgi:hypothetical protein
MTDECEPTSDNAPNEVVVSDDEDVVVERDIVDFWQFTEYARLTIGEEEYKSDPDFWAAQFQRDYETIKERLEIERKVISGDIVLGDFEEDLTPHEFVWEKVGGLRLLSLDQLILECNQGIFREDRFYCDKGRAWMKKVVKTLDAYGFPYVRKVEVEKRLLLEVSKNPMGVI